MTMNPGKRRNDLSAASSYEGGHTVLRARRAEFTDRKGRGLARRRAPPPGAKGPVAVRGLGQGFEDALGE